MYLHCCLGQTNECGSANWICRNNSTGWIERQVALHRSNTIFNQAAALAGTAEMEIFEPCDQAVACRIIEFDHIEFFEWIGDSCYTVGLDGCRFESSLVEYIADPCVIVPADDCIDPGRPGA